MDANGPKELISTTKPNDGEVHEIKDLNTFQQCKATCIFKSRVHETKQYEDDTPEVKESVNRALLQKHRTFKCFKKPRTMI